MASSACVDFSSYTGMPLPNWVDGRGTWRVATIAQGTVLMQTTGSMSRDDVFVAWQGGKDYGDVTIMASATLAITDMNCVLARVQGALDYYALCVNDVSRRNGPPAHEWRLNLSVRRHTTRSSPAAASPSPTRTCSRCACRARCCTRRSTATPSPPSPTATFAHGAAGVSTDDQGGFMSLCTVGL